MVVESVIPYVMSYFKSTKKKEPDIFLQMEKEKEMDTLEDFDDCKIFP